MNKSVYGVVHGKTHNTAEFQNIPGLRLEDWLEP